MKKECFLYFNHLQPPLRDPGFIYILKSPCLPVLLVAWGFVLLQWSEQTRRKAAWHPEERSVFLVLTFSFWLQRELCSCTVQIRNPVLSHLIFLNGQLMVLIALTDAGVSHQAGLPAPCLPLHPRGPITVAQVCSFLRQQSSLWQHHVQTAKPTLSPPALYLFLYLQHSL